MPSLAITFGQAPQAAHRVFSQFATMASRTLIMGRFDGGFSSTFSARFTPFRQAFVACLSTTARNKRNTRYFGASPPVARVPGDMPPRNLDRGKPGIRMCRVGGVTSSVAVAGHSGGVL